MIRADSIIEAMAHALTDALSEIVPLLQRLVLVRADHKVKVIAADRACVAGVPLLVDDRCDGARDFLAHLVINPENREI